jgi:hypothetical protein
MPTKSKQSTKISVPKQEYLSLKHQAQAYRNLVSSVFKQPLKDPVAEVVGDFKKTDLYTGEFLNDLEDGLSKSSYKQKYANQGIEK